VTVRVTNPRRENGDRNMRQVALSNPGKHLKTVFAGHLEVENDEVGQGVFFPIGEIAEAGKVFDGFRTVRDDVEGVAHTGLFECATHEKQIVLTVLDEQYNAGCFHGFGLSSSIQNWLPLFPSDSTPTEPPILSTALRTMARPMPVPS
jgi:hypothetical protein